MLEVRNLSKNFEGKNALIDFNMTVDKGSIYALVGINGSGKTTLIKHIAGIYRADSGDIALTGMKVYDNPDAKKLVGYVPDDLYFFPHYTLARLRKFYRSMYAAWDDERFEGLVSMMGLDTKARVGRFSKGMQKQSALTLALSIRPEFLLLDEPIDGLDPIVRKRIFSWIIEDVADRQMTVLISSHNLKEMDGICDTVGIIKGGRMLIERGLDELRSEMQEAMAGLSPSLDEIFIHVYEQEDGA